MMLFIKKHFSAVLHSFSELFFIKGIYSGLILVCISFVNYNAALSGLIAFGAAYAFARLIKFNDEFLNSGFYTYNPLLVGLSIGYMFKLVPLTIFFVVTAGIMTFIFTVFLSQIFSQYFGLSILSLPFVIVSSLVFLAVSQYSNLYVQTLAQPLILADPVFLPVWVKGFFTAIGAIIFMPNVLTGCLIFGMMLFSSRIMAFLAVFGYAIGSLITGWFTGSNYAAFLDVNSFNYILIAIAIGGVYLIPSLKSYLIAGIAVSVSTVLVGAIKVFWAYYGIPVFTLPFIIVTLTFLYVLGLVKYSDRTVVFKDTPEEIQDHFITTKHRFPSDAITVNLPFEDKWFVYQGFDGKWTHKGLWKYAYDFIKTDVEGRHYKNEGKYLDDYYCFGKSVVSPVQGRVVQVVSHLPDNPIGSVDTINNWGNMVLIYDARGVYVALSHFMAESLVVKEGDWVEMGAELGCCGNSGYSPEPHIHMQVQIQAVMGAPTIPFQFNHFIQADKFVSHGLPIENLVVGSLPLDLYYDQMTTFILDDSYVYDVFTGNTKIDRVVFDVKMALDGTFYFECDGSKLYFGKKQGTFYIYHLEGDNAYLKLLFLAMPRLPLNFSSGLTWTDYLADSTVYTRLQKAFVGLGKLFDPSLSVIQTQLSYQNDHVVVGTIGKTFFKAETNTSVTLDAVQKFKHVVVGDLALKRVVELD